MHKTNQKAGKQSALKMLTAIIMCVSLFMLTAANFVVYADYHLDKKVSWSCDGDDTKSADPVEENAKSCKGPTVVEEYLHDRHHINELNWLAATVHHRIMDAEKLSVIHFEIVSPPPKV